MASLAQTESGPSDGLRGMLLPLLVAALARGALLLLIEGDPGDGVVRTATAADWLTQHYRLFGAHTWPELNYLLPAAAISLSGEMYWGVRVLYAVLSLAIVPLAYVIGRDISDERGARAAAWMAALTPYLLVLSTDGARGEPLFAASALLCVFGAQRWSSSGYRLRWIVVAALGAVLAEGFRFDGVVVAAGVGFAMLVAAWQSRKSVRTAQLIIGLLLFAALSLAYPLALGIEWNARYGDPLHYMHTAQANSEQFLSGGEHPRWPTWFYRMYGSVFPLLGAAYTLSPVFFALAMWGLWRCIRLRRGLPLTMAIVAYGLFFMRGTVTFLTQPQLRYAAILGILLLPFIAEGARGVRALAGQIRPLSRIWAVGFATAALVQIVVAVATLKPLGMLSRQLSGTGLIQYAPFSTRQVLAQLDSLRPRRLLVSGFVPGSYIYLAKGFRRATFQIRYTSIYKNGTYVRTRDEYITSVKAQILNDGLVLVETGSRMQGFTDGLARDPLGIAVPAQDSVFTWEGYRLSVISRSSHLALLSAQALH